MPARARMPAAAARRGSRSGPRERCSCVGRLLLADLLQQFRHYRRPAGLMARAEPPAGGAVEVLVEKYKVAPMRIGLEALDLPEHGPAAAVAQEDRREPPR